jgi:hypothetical protein
MASISAGGRFAWVALWWLVAIGGCVILAAASLASLPF